MGIISTFARICSQHHCSLVECESTWGSTMRQSDLYCRAGNHWPEVVDVVNVRNRKVLWRVNVVNISADEE